VQPNSDILQVEKTGVKTNKRGFVQVNRFMETSAKNIWALGDIAGIYLFKHSANLEAEYVLNNILKRKKPVDYFPMPHAVFTNPQIAGVGVTEQHARLSRKPYVVGKYAYKSTGMGEALGEENGFVKLIVDTKKKDIIGCHILGPHASILLHEVLIALKAKQNALDLLRDTVHIHPALNEVVQRAALRVGM
jgi:mycothione reductase